MNALTLTPRELELAALGAALGANCAPCVDRHVGEALRAGLSEAQIRAAVAVADQVRKVPARKALEAAQQALDGAAPAPRAAEPCGCADLAGFMAGACAGR